MPKISVIVPVYNTEKYLPKCLDSLIAQTLSDIEIICVNDASTDGSLQILNQYAGKDNRIKIITFPQNKGAGAVRNIAIKEATGEYMGFIDSDDYVDLNFYENLYKKAVETGTQIVKGSDMKLCYPDREEIDAQNDKIRLNKINFWCQYTTAIYKRDFILENKIDFPEDLLVGEDPVFTIKAAVLADKVEVIDNAQYYYMRREGSLNSDFWDGDKVDSYIKYINTFIDISKKYDFDNASYDLYYTRLLEDVYWTRKRKTTLYSKDYFKLTKLYEYVRRHSVKRDKIKLLFDASILWQGMLSNSARRGIYWVSYNLVKHFLQDPRFEVSFVLETVTGKNLNTSDPLFKDVKTISKLFYLGSGAKYKVVNNINFKPYKYDVYFNTAHKDNLEVYFKPLRFYCLYDAMPMLKYDWFDEKIKDNFTKFHRNLSFDDYCFCDSNSCRDGFLRFFDQLNADHMMVVPICTSQDLKVEKNPEKLKQTLQKYGVTNSDKYMFYMGAADDGRKNLIPTVECFIKFIKKYKIDDFYFYIGGDGKEKLCNALREKLGKLYLDYAQYIVPLGYVADEDVNVLYSNSLFFSFLSLYEGFGMPPLEAMQAGTPVICANNSSLPEVVGDAAILVDAENEDEIIDAFKTFYFNEDKREEYIKKGFERAKMFSWDKTYKIISDKIIDVLKGSIDKPIDN